MSAISATAPRAHGLYRAIWRWHFYAGMFVIPFILLLSVTGAIYLFKPQIDRWEERAYRDLPTGGTVSATSSRSPIDTVWTPAACSSCPGCFHVVSSTRASTSWPS